MLRLPPAVPQHCRQANCLGNYLLYINKYIGYILGWVGIGWLGFGWVVLGCVGLGWIKLGCMGLGLDLVGWIGLV